MKLNVTKSFKAIFGDVDYTKLKLKAGKFNSQGERDLKARDLLSRFLSFKKP